MGRKSVLLLLSCYEKYEDRFNKKKGENRSHMEGCECRGESLTITNIYLFHVSFHLCIRFVTNGKIGAFYSSAKCSTKWKYLKERYTQIRENLRKDPKGRRTPWAFYEKMHHLCGEDDRKTLDYVQSQAAHDILRISPGYPGYTLYTHVPTVMSRIWTSGSGCRLDIQCG